MSTKRTWLNPKIAIAAAILAVAVGYLMYTSTQSTSASYFVTVSELAAEGDSVDGERVRVGGKVVPGSIKEDGVAGPLYFEITDGEQSLAVSYTEQVPDIFNDNVEAIVEGQFQQDGIFQAESVLTKCPSRFEDGEQAPDGHPEDADVANG